MKTIQAKKYVDMWACKDTDGSHVIYRQEANGKIDIAPFTFKTKESAAHYIQAHFPNDKVLSV